MENGSPVRVVRTVKIPSFHDRTRGKIITHLSGIGTLSFDRLPGVSEPVSQPLLISDVFGFRIVLYHRTVRRAMGKTDELR